MVTYVYRPDHPNASSNGHITKEEALEWDYYNNPDNRALIGNQLVQLNFISDIMPEIRNMVNGKFYTSKASFRQATKAAGCIEVGNDSSIVNPKPRKRIELSKKERRESIKKAIYDLKNGNNHK